MQIDCLEDKMMQDIEICPSHKYGETTAMSSNSLPNHGSKNPIYDHIKQNKKAGNPHIWVAGKRECWTFFLNK